MSKCELKVDWATHEAAKYACEHWHYSGSLPVSKLVKLGVWEEGKYIGVVLFSRGANRNLLKPYGLTPVEGCELTRIALTGHKSPVSRIIKVAIKKLAEVCPDLRMIISFADMDEGHNGAIYQASNWVYVGRITQTSRAEYKGRVAHKRTFDSAGIKGYKMLGTKGKHKYLMPLDKAMRKQIEPLAKPYPKRPSDSGASTPIEERRCKADPDAPVSSRIARNQAQSDAGMLEGVKHG